MPCQVSYQEQTEKGRSRLDVHTTMERESETRLVITTLGDSNVPNALDGGPAGLRGAVCEGVLKDGVAALLGQQGVTDREDCIA